MLESAGEGPTKIPLLLYERARYFCQLLQLQGQGSQIKCLFYYFSKLQDSGKFVLSFNTDTLILFTEKLCDNSVEKEEHKFRELFVNAKESEK